MGLVNTGLISIKALIRASWELVRPNQIRLGLNFSCYPTIFFHSKFIYYNLYSSAIVEIFETRVFFIKLFL